MTRRRNVLHPLLESLPALFGLERSEFERRKGGVLGSLSGSGVGGSVLMLVSDRFESLYKRYDEGEQCKGWVSTRSEAGRKDQKVQPRSL
jgi:hypothetical protein